MVIFTLEPEFVPVVKLVAVTLLPNVAVPSPNIRKAGKLVPVLKSAIVYEEVVPPVCTHSAELVEEV